MRMLTAIPFAGVIAASSDIVNAAAEWRCNRAEDERTTGASKPVCRLKQRPCKVL